MGLGQITVTTTNDTLDSDADISSLAALKVNPGADGEVSLREAIIAANTDSLSSTRLSVNTGIYMLFDRRRRGRGGERRLGCH